MESPTKEQTIRALCDSWVKAAYQPGGGIAISAGMDGFRLHRNRIVFHELSYEELQAACTGLSKVLLLKRMNTIIDVDHQLLWACAGEMLLHAGPPGSSFFTRDEHELQELFATAVRSSLARIVPAGTPHKDFMPRFNAVEHNAQQLVTKAHLVLAYLALPLLEGLLKKVCAAHVDYSGKVITAFDVPRTSHGRARRYESNHQCSSLRDLLFLLHQTVTDQDLRPRLDEMRVMLQELEPHADPFDTIYAWRNQSLHGQASFPTIGGTLLNLAILIALNQLRPDFEARRAATVKSMQWQMRNHSPEYPRSPWSYYPPF